MKAPKARFNILKFENPRTGTCSWRVSGIKRNGERIRQNFADSAEAQLRYTELEGEYHAASGVAALRATRLSDEEVGIAEAAFKRLERPEDLITAVDHWLRTGRPAAVAESPRLDDAFNQYNEWVDATTELRPLTKERVRRQVRHFVSQTGNMRVADVLPDHVEHYLGQLKVSAVTKLSRISGRAERREESTTA